MLPNSFAPFRSLLITTNYPITTMGQLEALVVIWITPIVLLLVSIVNKVTNETCHTACIKAHQTGVLKDTSEDFIDGMRRGLLEGGELGVEHISKEDILKAIRKRIYTGAENFNEREWYRSDWLQKVGALDVEREENFRSVWLKETKELHAE